MTTMKPTRFWKTTSTAALLAPLALACGCGDDGDDDETAMLKITAEAPPALLAYRNAGETAWTPVEIGGALEWELPVAERYELVSVCERTGPRPRVFVAQRARTVEDGLELTRICQVNEIPFKVSGTVMQPGQMALGNAASGSSQDNWSFSLPARAGVFDLYMFGGDFNVGLERFGARRGVTVTGDLDLGELDLAQEDLVALVPATYQVANALPDEQLSANVSLISGDVRTALMDFTDDLTVNVVPSSALLASEGQFVSVGTLPDFSAEPGSLQLFRSVTVKAATQTLVVLPEQITGLAFQHDGARSLATWSRLPDYDALLLFRDSFPQDKPWVFHRIEMSRAYATATRTSQLELDFSGVPGFLPEWQSAADDLFLNLSVDKGTGLAEGSSAGGSQDLSSAGSALRSRPLDARELRAIASEDPMMPRRYAR
jgi:hypothetical protein